MYVRVHMSTYCDILTNTFIYSYIRAYTCTYVYLPWVGGMGVRSVQGSRYEACQLLSIYMPKWRFFLPSIQRFASHFSISDHHVSCEVCELTRLWMLCRVDLRGLVRLSGLGRICPFVVLDHTDLGATIVVAPGQMPGGFLPSPDADCLPFLVKLVP
jgi:hypothetical protein